MYSPAPVYPAPPGGYGGYPPPVPIQSQPLLPTSQATAINVNVPYGLEYLAQVDGLFVVQQVEMLEAFVGMETNNMYSIRDNLGRPLYYALEDTACCVRCICGPQRPFEIRVRDPRGLEVMHFTRRFAFTSCWCPCWLQKLEVFAPLGTLCGTVEQTWSICCPRFVVKDALGQVVFKIAGPCCTFSCCGDVEFDVLTPDGSTPVGKISKKWSGLAREMFTDADNFGIRFPLDLDVRIKAVMLGACLLIDFMLYESRCKRPKKQRFVRIV